jgi:glycine/D-amino acid oxidase-like deaminating enzyme
MNKVFWLDEPHQDHPPLIGDITVDAVVIGAGICGVSAAYTLEKEGLKVALIDSRSIASGATGRNAGFILQGTAERYNRAIEVMGHTKAKAIHSWTILNHERMAQVIKEHNIDCDYQQAGSLQLAGSKQEEEELLVSAELLKKDGFEAEVRRANDMPEAYRRAGFQMGVFLPKDGELHPARFVRGMAKVLKQTMIFEHTKALQIEDDNDGVCVHTEKGSIRAEIAIVCTNAYTNQLFPQLSDWIDPVRGQMLTTAPLPRLFPHPIYADHGYDYWRQDRKGRIILGGWRNLDPDAEIGFDEILNPEIQQNMTKFLTVFPSLEQLDVTHRWSGIMGFSKDGLPILGGIPSYQATLIAAGFTGHGFGFGWLAGESIAKLSLEGNDPFCSLLSSRRFY